MDTSRDTTLEERLTWGTCTACGAKHGERCDPSYGIPLGHHPDGSPPRDGVHFGRLSQAPVRVRLVPV